MKSAPFTVASYEDNELYLCLFIRLCMRCRATNPFHALQVIIQYLTKTSTIRNLENILFYGNFAFPAFLLLSTVQQGACPLPKQTRQIKFKYTFLQCLPWLNSSSGPHFPVCYESVPSDPWCGLVFFCVMAFC